MNVRSVLYLCFIEVFAVGIFMYSFFPIKPSSGKKAVYEDLPEKLIVSRLDKKDFYAPKVDRFVIMVIDALRFDFIDGPYGTKFMPYTTKAIHEKNACLVKAKAEPPTVTMPRIKALTTGTIPNFVDMIMNLGSSNIKEDNIIHQAEKNGLKVIFYGDETWLKLFPTSFMRKEGTTSFFVTDYTEVDLNVTKMVEKEIEKHDWDIMILHYLGLDHIGHLEGPRSSLVGPKLEEMDQIILKIHQSLQKLEFEGLRQPVLIVCADHGMKNSGSHGGTTPAEVDVPIVLFNHQCPINNKFLEMNQVDIVPHISMLLGLPIPADSVGKLDTRLIGHKDSRAIVYSLHYNVDRLWKLLLESQGETAYQTDGYKFYLEGMKFFDGWIQSNFTSNMNASSIAHYISAQSKLSEDLIRDSIHFDIRSLSMSIAMLSQVLLMVVLVKNVVLQQYLGVIMHLFLFLLITNYMLCYYGHQKSLFCSWSLGHMTVVILSALISSVNVVQVVIYSRKVQVQLPRNSIFLLGILLQSLGIFSTSYIEEEHQLWYFLFSSFCICHVFRNFTVVLLLMVAIRILRTLNQTGDKWASLPDVGDWLNDNTTILFLLYVSGLICIKLCSLKDHLQWNMDKLLWRLYVFVHCLQLILIGLYKISTRLEKLPFISFYTNRNNIEVELFWTIMLFKLLLFLPFQIKKPDGQIGAGMVLDTFVLAIALLYRLHNLILLPSLYFLSHLTAKIIIKNEEELTIIHYWLGMVFYFLQGNSNCFATVDVATGYTGLTTYNMFLTGTFLFVHTFAAPLLSYLLLIKHLAHLRMVISRRGNVYRVLMFFSSLNVFLFTLFITFNRHHLFIWSVFAPKLLYIGTFVALHVILIFMTEALIFLFKFS